MHMALRVEDGMEGDALNTRRGCRQRMEQHRHGQQRVENPLAVGGGGVLEAGELLGVSSTRLALGGGRNSSDCGDFQLSRVVDSPHNLVIFLLASSLEKMHSQDGRASDSKRAGGHLPCSTVDLVTYDVQHVPMSLIRDEDRFCCIIGIFIIVSCFSLSNTIFLFLVLRICSHYAVHIVSSVAPPHHFAVVGYVHL